MSDEIITPVNGDTVVNTPPTETETTVIPEEMPMEEKKHVEEVGAPEVTPVPTE